ncbi:MAG: hypothetical protein HDT42_01350 [Ruminococcaceae bacterium]|nr:hypothetical protein [Oscillospiraceae bacterium]
MKEIYIVISKTGTILCKMLRLFTHEEYNHASLSLDGELNSMFSFGRIYPYIPWLGGFVEESPHFGTMKRFSETEVRVLTVSVSDEVYDKLNNELHQMLSDKCSYHYDVFGLICAAFNKVYRRKNYYYCSAFVRDVLVKHGIESPDLFPEIVRPTDFLEIPDCSEIYNGKLREFAGAVNT